MVITFLNKICQVIEQLDTMARGRQQQLPDLQHPVVSDETSIPWWRPNALHRPMRTGPDIAISTRQACKPAELSNTYKLLQITTDITRWRPMLTSGKWKHLEKTRTTLLFGFIGNIPSLYLTTEVLFFFVDFLGWGKPSFPCQLLKTFSCNAVQ